MLAIVNERNRKANLEAVRKAELIDMERKRKERKIAAQAGSRPGTPNPLQDPSARLKTTPRLFSTASPRPSTPNPTLMVPSNTTTGRVEITQVGEKAKSLSLERSIIDSIEVNLGDF